MVITPDGDVIPFREGSSETVFDHFMDTIGHWGEGEDVVTFASMVQRWLKVWDSHGGGEKTLFVEDASGFGAQLGRVEMDGKVVGVIAVAGFLQAERAVQGVDRVRSLLPQHLVKRIESGKGAPSIVQLGREDRRWVDRCLRNLIHQIEAELGAKKDELFTEEGVRFAGMMGTSEAMRRVFRDMAKVARTESTVLITGENGTGKELVARGIHRHSRRCHNRFVAINCAAIPADLIASELFGHVKGAFSGAHRDRVGLFEAANGGTLLLDEIGDMEPGLQTKLLRVLQEGTFLPVGGSEVRRVNVRVLCATNCDLEQMVKAKTFREDLYYRIRVIQLKIPALRERGDDVELLADHFLQEAVIRHGKEKKVFSEGVRAEIGRYRWPGNVRELENEVERLVIMSGDDEVIGEEWLNPRMARVMDDGPALDFEGYELPEAIEYLERKMILRALEKTGWNKSQAARELGVSRRNLIRKVTRYELEGSDT